MSQRSSLAILFVPLSLLARSQTNLRLRVGASFWLGLFEAVSTAQLAQLATAESSVLIDAEAISSAVVSRILSRLNGPPSGMSGGSLMRLPTLASDVLGFQALDSATRRIIREVEDRLAHGLPLVLLLYC